MFNLLSASLTFISLGPPTSPFPVLSTTQQVRLPQLILGLRAKVACDAQSRARRDRQVRGRTPPPTIPIHLAHVPLQLPLHVSCTPLPVPDRHLSAAPRSNPRASSYNITPSCSSPPHSHPPSALPPSGARYPCHAHRGLAPWHVTRPLVHVVIHALREVARTHTPMIPCVTASRPHCVPRGPPRIVVRSHQTSGR